MALQGHWFDGKTSGVRSVELELDDAGYVRVMDSGSGALVLEVPFNEVRVSPRIGNTPRYLHFPDRQKFETRDHAQVDQWLQMQSPSRWQGLIHKLESHIYFVALTLLLVVSFSYCTIVYGLPAASRYIAFKLPQSLMDRAATETLQILDKTQLGDTELDEETRNRVLKHFAPAIEQNKNLHIKVIFRKGDKIGANAFALPDGTVLFTDEIVKLAKNDDELLAVLAHEIGHVRHRHALRAAIQGSVVSFGVAMLTGDLSAASNLLATLPVLITTMSYSRDFEREADNNSLVFLDAHHVARHYFVDLMERLTYQSQCQFYWSLEGGKNQPSSETCKKDESCQAKVHINFDDKEDRTQCDRLIAEHKNDLFHSKMMGYFASHPETKERVQKFKMNRDSGNQ